MLPAWVKAGLMEFACALSGAEASRLDFAEGRKETPFEWFLGAMIIVWATCGCRVGRGFIVPTRLVPGHSGWWAQKRRAHPTSARLKNPVAETMIDAFLGLDHRFGQAGPL